PEASTKHLRQLRQRTRRMETLLDDLLAYSRAGKKPGGVSEVDLQEVVEDAVELLNLSARFSVECNWQVRRLRGHRTPLETVVRNLVANSVKHHDRGEGSLRVEAKQCGDMAAITVSDDGPGIDPRYRARVFKMFETLKPRDEVEGSGIGLALVKKIVESEGGEVTLDSAEPRGLCVRFTWPLSAVIE
ncbi:MAG: HAMP domain-containing histidine kinase, partial [Planctomycetales bacterium]|nr:HAMP domain-containing histidine kinase [Planctomycetales bacterium]